MNNQIDESRIILEKYICPKCKHEWFPRSEKPQRCPRCQYWLDSVPKEAKLRCKECGKILPKEKNDKII